jgi:hypothetical protein
MDYQVGAMGSSLVRPQRTSDIIARVARDNQANTVTVGELVDALKDRSFGVVIIFFALPNVIVPISWVLGTPILLLTVQMVIGRQTPWLPQIMRRQEISGETFAKIASYVVTYLAKIEKWLKPRWSFLSTDWMERLIGLYLTFLTLVLLVPIPFGNALPAFGIAIVAAGLIEKDGVAVLVGSLIGLAGALYIVILLGGIWTAFKAIFGF